MGKKTQTTLQACFLLFLIAATAAILHRHASPQAYQKIGGAVFHTQYHITYQHSQNYRQDIEQLLHQVDQSLSSFNPHSTLSLINQNKRREADAWVERIFSLAQNVSQHTHGAFDITVAPLVNAWGFGFEKPAHVPNGNIDSILQIVGYQKVRLEGHSIIKQHPAIQLDCSGIAKGFACDVVADFLERQGISNYMIEIGGEIRANGQNPNGRPWVIGISTPKDDSLHVNINDIASTMQLFHGALATSGNYRNFRILDGKKVAHTIDPRTGRPAQLSIVSSSVTAPTCAEADAYATAFMVLGMEESQRVLAAQPQLQALFIYTDDDGQLKMWHTPHWQQPQDKQ